MDTEKLGSNPEVSEIGQAIFERVNAAGVRLADFGLKAETGKIQFDKYREYAQPANDGGAGRLIWAENIQRYALRPSRHRAGKEWLAPSISTAVPPNITGAGIVTQRISANEQPRRIIAALVEPEGLSAGNVYSENHTNFIPLNDRSNPEFLLGALNSSIMEFVFRRLNSNTQVSAGEINQLPFPPLPGPRRRQEIAELVSGLLRLGGVGCGPAAAAQAMTWEHRLDLLMGGLYGFSPAEVEQIQQSLPPYETVYGLPPPLSGGGGIAARGQAIYDQEIRPRLEGAADGKLAVIDVYSGDYEIDADYAAATRRLLRRRPGVITYAVRVGHPAAFKLRSPRRASPRMAPND